MKKVTLILLLCISVLNLFAQAGYECDFEDDAINATWRLNNGGHGQYCANQWFVGTAINNGGKKALYISGDDGVTAEYISGEKNGVCVIAEIDLTLPNDTYEIAFDWQALGMGSDALYACWVPDSIKTNSSKTSILASFVKEYALNFSMVGGIRLNNNLWNSVYTTFISDGTPHKLVFVWNNGVGGAFNPGACVDNINIVPANTCQKPHHMEMFSQDTSVLVRWEGLGDSYDIRFKSREGDEWQEYYDYAADSIILYGFPEGVLDMYIRTNCGDLNTIWVHYSQFSYHKSSRCIDFLDLNNTNCWFGSNFAVGTAGNPANAFLSQRKIDDGYESIKSRHTIHYNKYELDPRTGGGLQTVWEQEIASVRLGNWHNKAEAEGLIYKLDIPADAEEILLVNYAIVMEDPNHEIQNQPKFGIQILRDDEDETPLDTFGCTQADFTAGWNTDSWQTFYPLPTEAIPKPASVKWLDWSTIAISLRDYAGEKLKIKLYTLDCSGGAHYAYAYFALSCASAELEGLSCGDSETADFLAPEGFHYKWYKESEPDKPLGKERAFSIDAEDNAIYACDVIQILNKECYYTLYASSTPRYPRAEGSYEQKVENCQSIVQFSDSSYVILELEDGDSITKDAFSSILWDFGDNTTSTEIHPKHIFPEEGGTYTVKQTVYLATCEDIKEYELTLPKLGTIRDTLPISLCLGYTYTDPSTGKNYMRAGDFSDTTIHSNGCDSIYTLSIKMVESVDTVFTDTVCSADLPYEYMDIMYNESGEYRDTIRAVQGCDSVYSILKLTVNESLVLSLSDSVSACADDENLIIPYTLSSGMVSSFSVFFDSEDAKSMNVDSLMPSDSSLIIPLSSDIDPNNYDLSVVFENMDCGSVTKDITLHLFYPDTILSQRWNDVIGIRNATYNGGYDFTAYQWFEDGKPLEGQTSSNLYLPLVENAEYSALITRKDGVQTFTCPLIARKFADTKDTPGDVIFEETSINVSSKSAKMAKIWNVSGILVSATALSDTNTQIPLPKYAGVYILEIINQDGSRTTQKFLVSSL